MNIFFILFFKIAPLYITIVLGFIAAHFLHVKREDIAKLLIYILGAIVVFKATLSVKIDTGILLLPVFLYLLATLGAFLGLYIFKKIWNDAQANILAFSCATGNTGYFGIPLAMIFFPPHLVDVYIFTLLASFLYESSSGFYIVAKGHLNPRQALNKMLHLPPIYAFIIGLLCNSAGVTFSAEIMTYMDDFKVVYGILGMMMIGLGLVGLNFKEGIDSKFIITAFSAKFIVFPSIVLFVIFIDKTYFMLFNEQLYKVLFIYSIVPLAGNSVTYAVLFDANPQKVSLTVLLSTFFSLIFIPIALYFYGDFY